MNPFSAFAADLTESPAHWRFMKVSRSSFRPGCQSWFGALIQYAFGLTAFHPAAFHLLTNVEQVPMSYWKSPSPMKLLMELFASAAATEAAFLPDAPVLEVESG